MISALAISAALSGTPCALVGAAQIELRDGRLTLSDVVATGCDALAQSGDIMIAALPAGIDRVTLSRPALASLVRRRVPDLVIEEPVEAIERDIELWRDAAESRSAGPPCFELVQAMPRATALVQNALTPTACASARRPIAIAYDRRHGIVRTAEDSEAGDYVGQLIGVPASLIEQGQALQLRVTAGPVTITREVIAAQPARPGDNVFVRDTDGHTFSAPSGVESENRP